MQKKILVWLGVLTLGTVGAQGSFREPQLGPIQDKVTLQVWAWVSSVKDTAKLFEQRYPNVKVIVQNPGDGQNKLRTALQAGAGAPDVAQVEYAQLPGFVETGGLVDLSRYGANAVKANFLPWTWRQVSPDGKAVYGIPQDTGPFAMVYRKDIFDRYKLKVPTTWAEYAATAEQLNKASGGKVKMGNFVPDWAPWFVALTWANGGRLFERDGDRWVQTLNSPAAKQVATYWGDLVKKGLVTTYPGFSQDFWNAMSKGEIATSMQAAWGAGGWANSVDKSTANLYRVAPLPQWNKTRFVTGNAGGSTNVVTTQSKHPRDAAIFAMWLNASRDAITANWNGSGLFPAAADGLNLPVLSDTTKNPGNFFGGQNVSAVYAQAARNVNVNFDWAPWFPKAGDNLTKQLDAALKGRVSYAQALDAWQAEVLAQAQKDGYDVRGK